MQLIGSILFGLAIIHTFLVSKFQHIAHHYPEGSVGENFFHYMGEVEAVFGMWAAIFVTYVALSSGLVVYDEQHQVVGGAIHFLESLNFTEPAFVFVIMCMAGTRPVIIMSSKLITFAAKVLPFPKKMAFYISALVVGPLLGSFITEPAAMTVTALILLDKFYSGQMSDKFKYATLGLLFVNISIGGTLTHFAAPPVLMVAGKWGWGMSHMLGHFGYKAAVSILVCTFFVAIRFKNELTGEVAVKEGGDGKLAPPWWVYLTHILFLIGVVMTAHHMVFFLGLFLFFLGFAVVTKEYQSKLKVTESLMVGFFLGGLVTLGSQQEWWLKPVISSMGDVTLFTGATILTAFTDNAALTYLGSLVPTITESAKYFLVAGAVTGGGLTVIANAPNPAGYGILKGSFGADGISPIGLAKAAFLPTIVAYLAFLFLPSFGL
jgi:hypothetical protein